jgi:PRC-barrel domain
MYKALLIAAALVLPPLALSGQEVRGGKDRDAPLMQTPPTQRGAEGTATTEQADSQSKSPFGDQVADAIETVEDACAADIEDYCGAVPSGRGGLALCMLSHEGLLSARCRFGLYRAARKLESNVGQVAEMCLKEIQGLCGETGGIRQCLEQKKGSLSSSCRRIVEAVGQRAHRLMGLVGMPVLSSDNKELGQVVEVTKGPDGKIQSIQFDIGRLLGIGSKVVAVTADKLERLPGIKLQLSEKDVRSLPEAKKQ